MFQITLAKSREEEGEKEEHRQSVMRFTQAQKVDKKREKQAYVLSKCQRPKLNKYRVIYTKNEKFSG